MLLTEPNRPGRYQYDKLQHGQIRLIRIDAAHESAKQASHYNSTFLSVKTTRLEDAPEFTALSYCWGDVDLTPKEPLYCDGKIMMVPQNLASVLREFPLECYDEYSCRAEEMAFSWMSSTCHDAFREEDFFVRRPGQSSHLNDTPLFLWADAICINQTDQVEKEEQIPRMREIYSGAREVFVYLGDDLNCQEIFTAAYRMSKATTLKAKDPSYDLSRVMSKIDTTSIMQFLTNPVFKLAGSFKRWP